MSRIGYSYHKCSGLRKHYLDEPDVQILLDRLPGASGLDFAPSISTTEDVGVAAWATSIEAIERSPFVPYPLGSA